MRAINYAHVKRKPLWNRYFPSSTAPQMIYACVCAVDVKIEETVNLVLPRRRVVRLTLAQDRTQFINVNLSLLAFSIFIPSSSVCALIEPWVWIKHQRCMFGSNHLEKYTVPLPATYSLIRDTDSSSLPVEIESIVWSQAIISLAD